MKKKIIGLLAFGFLNIHNVSAQETFKVMFYNLLNYPLEDAVPNREDDLEFILSDYQPDLFLVCELNNITGANNVLNITRTAINSNFEMATYTSNTSDDSTGDQNDLQNLLYYDSTKFILEEEIIVPTTLRDFNIYKIKLNTIDNDINPVEIYIVVCHLKASSGAVNAQRRFEMVLELDNYLDSLPSNSNVVLGGDLNVYTANEAAFQLLLGNNNITFVDPANRIGSWNNNSNFIDVFTQSTRTQSGMGGATGGFDDRFDFILTSENMLSNANITFVPDSYKVYGNNGVPTCYNNAINSPNCETAIGSEFSFEIRDALHNFSDHLPVTISLEANVTLLNTNAFNFSKKITLKNSLIDSDLVVYINSPELFNKQGAVYNHLGQIVDLLKTNTNQRQTFKISNLSNGIYYLDFFESNTQPLKFVVSH